jgi:hypothetical protein
MAFLSRCRLAARQSAEKEIEAEKEKFRPKFAALGAEPPEGATQDRRASSVLSLINPFSWGSKKPDDKLSRLEAEWFARGSAIYESWKRVGEEYSDVLIKPLKKNIRTVELGLAWAPFWQIRTAAGVDLVAAYR